ncbi:hypothetical protein ACQCN2_09210 [Brevibacillus ginsengisoli]|uniref:hypothetical protein n=1 Tax=Brevibacillus ginsengisoli TaxID=363854 RepID=UPI003CED51A2
MNRDVLEDYLDHQLLVYFQDNQKTPPYEEGVLKDFSPSGILLEADDGALLFIPFASIEMLQIQPKISWWQKLSSK